MKGVGVGGGNNLSPPTHSHPLPGRRPGAASASRPATGQRLLGGKKRVFSGAMKDRMQELRHVSERVVVSPVGRSEASASDAHGATVGTGAG